jgi:hypothetical protein
MIKHLVLFKFHDGIDWTDARAQQAEQVTRGHPAHIPEILGWEVGRNVSDRSQAYDFALIGTFADQTAVTRYLCHQDHQRGVRMWRDIATWVVADFNGPETER